MAFSAAVRIRSPLVVFTVPPSVALISLSRMSSAMEASTAVFFVASTFRSPVRASVPETELVLSAWSDSAFTVSAPMVTLRLIAAVTLESPYTMAKDAPTPTEWPSLSVAAVLLVLVLFSFGVSTSTRIPVTFWAGMVKVNTISSPFSVEESGTSWIMPSAVM